MALTFPLDLATFFEAVARVEMTFYPSENVNTRRQANGNLIVSEYGARFWRGAVQLVTLLHADQNEVEALCEVLQESYATFQASPRHLDQSGNTANPTLANVTGGYQVTLNATGASRIHRRGTMFSFAYGGRQALHRMVEQMTSTSGGVLGPFQVVPAVQPGWAAATAVQLRKPYCVAKMVPNSYRPPGHRAAATVGPSFEWEQVL